MSKKYLIHHNLTYGDCYDVLIRQNLSNDIEKKFQDIKNVTDFNNFESSLVAEKFFELGYAAAHIGYINEQNTSENSLGARTPSGRNEEVEKPSSVLEKKSKKSGKKGTLF